MDFKALAERERATGMAYPMSAAGAPKEIGVLQRLDGVRSGVTEIEFQLRAFIAKLSGGPTNENSTSTCACQAGLSGAISDTEASIRETLSMLKNLGDAF